VPPVGAVLEATRGTPATPARPGEGYRPHLDGLRAVAVYLVVLFHARADRFSGGFIGVDVFFVLSGYLVTQLLLRDLSGRGALRFGRFYARRMRRLLPASFVLLVVTAVVFSALAAPAEVASGIGAFKAAFLYVANWYFIHQSSDYFAATIDSSPIIHFWSLAVEEQFYLVWPVLLTGLYLATRRLRTHAQHAMQLAIAVAALASVLWALHLSTTNLNRAYYGTDARAYQLMAGALIAVTPGLLRRVVRLRFLSVAAAAALLALLGLSTSAFTMGAIQRGIAVTIVTVTLIVAIECARGGPVNRVLSCPPMVYLGKISYGTYLWHWPVIWVILEITDGDISPLSTFGLAALVGTGLASLSYTILERPIREYRPFDRVSRVVVAGGLALTVIGALVIIPRILDPSRTQVDVATVGQQEQVQGFTPVGNLDLASAKVNREPDQRNVPFLASWNCLGKPPETCTIVKGRGERVLVIGDSLAWSMFPTFAELALKHDLTLSTAASAGCPWQRGLYFAEPRAAQFQLRKSNCLAMKQDLYTRVIPALKPDLIVAVSAEYIAGAAAQNKALRRQIDEDTRQSLAELEPLAGKIALIEPLPRAPDTDVDPYVCLGQSKVIEQCRFVDDGKPTEIETEYRSVADNSKVFALNLDQVICPFLPICDPVVGGKIVRFDDLHLTPSFATSIAEPVGTILEDAGLLER
jgi:peptidoglycan/LPS O-acetylase OafA/YrhL